jgi:hypothetical protein
MTMTKADIHPTTLVPPGRRRCDQRHNSTHLFGAAALALGATVPAIATQPEAPDPDAELPCIGNNCRAPTVVHCASISQNLRCVSTIVRPTPAPS